MRFGIAKPAIPFQQAWSTLGPHQPRVQHSYIWSTVCYGIGHDGFDECPAKGGYVGGSVGRRIRTHSTSVRSLISIERPLVVLRQWQRAGGQSVAKGNQRILRPGKALLNDDLSVCQSISNCVDNRWLIVRQTDALATGETGLFHNNRHAQSSGPCERRVFVARSEHRMPRLRDSKPGRK